MIKAIVSGAAGRMGKRIITALSQTEGIELGAALEVPGNPVLGQDAGELAGVGKTGINITASVEEALAAGNVIIDFSSPTATVQHLQAADKAGVAMVIGTTGLSPEDIARVQEASQKIPCVMAPNMSVGVNLLLNILPQMARVLNDYDIEIVETHHRHKKDAPSGTALKMAEVLAQALERDLDKVGVYGRYGFSGERPTEQIGIHAVRGGDIVGVHNVLFTGLGETIEVIHRAHSRDTFAQGAVRAAKFAANAPVGLYDMQDVLGLKK